MKSRAILALLLGLLVVLCGCQTSQLQSGGSTTVPTTTSSAPVSTTVATDPPLTTVPPTTESQAGYNLEEAYTYPVLPGTDEWNAMDSHADQLKACQIPEDILSRLTTRALLETVLDYPLMVDMHSYSNMEQGFLSVKSQFNGLQELVSRSDAKEIAEAFTLKGTRWEENSLIEMSLQAIIKYGLTTYIEGPYVYPLTVGTEAELLDACQVPKDILAQLSDDDLILTVVNHPLIDKVLEDGFDQTAYKDLCQSINCLGELDLRGASMAMKIFAHMGDPTGVEEYALGYYDDVLTALFTLVAS